jgi:uncharacterized membrane protein
VETFLNAVHVLAAVLLIGPLVFAPFVARRAIGRRSADGVRAAANQMAFFGGGSLLVAGLGVVALLTSDRYDFGTPWVIVSITLYVIALVLIYFYAIPALRKAARMVEQGVVGGALDVADGEEPTPLTTTSEDLRDKERLDAISGRIAGAGALVLLVFAAITLLMSARPFGS